VKDVIEKAFKDENLLLTEEQVKKSWLEYFRKINASPQQAYETLRNAIRLMKKYYVNYDPKQKKLTYNLKDFTPSGYELAKEGEKYSISKYVENLVKFSGGVVDFDQFSLENALYLAKRSGWDYDVLTIFVLNKAGEKYVPIFSFKYSDLRVSEEVASLVKEVAREEGVREEEELMDEFLNRYFQKVQDWKKEVKQEYVKSLKEKYPPEKVKAILEVGIDHLLYCRTGTLKDGKKVAIHFSFGVVYVDKENWKVVREELKEELRDLARNLQSLQPSL